MSSPAVQTSKPSMFSAEPVSATRSKRERENEGIVKKKCDGETNNKFICLNFVFSEDSMPKAKKVYTPGTQPSLLARRGRPKKDKKKKGTSRKGNYRTKYTDAVFLEALQAVKDKRMSVREAAKHYGVPKTTLLDRLHNRRGQKLGRTTELSEEEEELIVERLLVLDRWGFPLGKKDLTHLIKNYLDRQGASTRDVSSKAQFFL